MELSIPETVALPDGTPLTLRAIQPDDAPRLQALHAHLSRETIYLRFLSIQLNLSDAEAQRLATVNYQTTMALVAVNEDKGEAVIRGVARYAASERAPMEAEAAIVIEDAYQGKGLGTILLDRLLAYAQSHGIKTFVAEINAENERMLRFVRRSGLPVVKRMEEGVWEIRVKLEDK